MQYFLTPPQTYIVLTSLIFRHCFPSLSLEETTSICNPVTCWWSLLLSHQQNGPLFYWLMCLFLSSRRTTPPENSCVSAVDNNGQIWLSWLLTCTRTTQKTSSAAWTWRQPCMMFILCPMICAVTLPKGCWSEWENLPNTWSLLIFLCFLLTLLHNDLHHFKAYLPWFYWVTIWISRKRVIQWEIRIKLL